MTKWPAKPVSSESPQSKDSDAVPRRQQQDWGCSLFLRTIPTGFTESNKQNNKHEVRIFSLSFLASCPVKQVCYHWTQSPGFQDFRSHQFPYSDEVPLLFTAFALHLPHLQLSYSHLKLHRIQMSVPRTWSVYSFLRRGSGGSVTQALIWWPRTGPKGTAWSCVREGLRWILGKGFSPWGWWSTEQVFHPEKWSWLISNLLPHPTMHEKH